jgi:hypothetical protein
MSVIPSAKQLASWAERCSGNDESPANAAANAPAKAASGWASRSKKPLWPLRAARTPTSPPVPTPEAQNRSRPRARRRQTLDADRLLAHVQYRKTYRDLGGDYYARRDPAGATKRLVSKLEALVHTVMLQPIPA